jgi:hypothetical protein
VGRGSIADWIRGRIIDWIMMTNWIVDCIIDRSNAV